MIALMGSAAKRVPVLRVEIESMIGRPVSTDQKLLAHQGMLHSDVIIFGFSCLLVRPKQKRKVQQTIDDHSPAVLRVPFLAPCLDNANLRPEASDQKIGGPQRKLLGLLAPRHPPLGYRG
ncbi:hypothetical protein D3C76_1504520 [compost metagenome]